MHTINKNYWPSILSFFILTISLMMSGCQATSKHAGMGKINLSLSAADGAERYFASNVGQAFAVSTYGGRWGSSSCSSVNCSYRTGSAEGNALESCERGGATCAMLAIHQDIVWKGNVTLPNAIEDRYILKILRKRANRTSHYTGTAKIHPNGTTGTLQVNISGDHCLGDFDITKQAWSLDCASYKYFGKITKNETNRFWGLGNGGTEISISQNKWPHLRKKLQERYAASTGKELTTTAPTKSDNDNTNEKQAILKWAHVWGGYEGHITYEKSQPKGTMKFRNKTTNAKCTGQFEVFYGTTGTWKMACSDDTRAEGTIRFKNDYITGKGTSNLGAKVTFRTLEQ